jgi:hypothetical protein
MPLETDANPKSSKFRRLKGGRCGRKSAAALAAVPLPGQDSPRADSSPPHGRTGVWRGCFRSSMSVSAPFVWRCLSGSAVAPFPPAPFVWRCLSGSAVAPFPHPPHRTGHADFPLALRRHFLVNFDLTSEIWRGMCHLSVFVCLLFRLLGGKSAKLCIKSLISHDIAAQQWCGSHPSPYGGQDKRFRGRQADRRLASRRQLSR